MEQMVDGAMRLLAFLFSATFGRAYKTGQLEKAVLVFVIVASIPVVAIGIYFAMRGKGHGVEWQPITCLTPRHGQSTILGLSTDAIHLKFDETTNKGVRIWEGKPWPTFLGDPICFDGVPVDAHAPKIESCQPTFLVPFLPGSLNERAAVLERDEGGRLVCLEIAILTDESVWYWRSAQYEAADLLFNAFFFGGFIGCLVGFAAVWLMMLLQQNPFHRVAEVNTSH